MKHIKMGIFLMLFAVVLVGCGDDQEENTQDDINRFDEEEENELTVEIMNGEEETIGTALLTEVTSGVQVELQATNLPEGELAFHFHENGICESPDFESAGDHFNPEDKQ